MTFELGKRTRPSPFQHSPVSENTGSRADCANILFLPVKFVQLLHQWQKCLQVLRSRHSSRQDDHIRFFKINLFKHFVHMNRYTVRTGHFPFLRDGHHIRIDSCPSQQVYHGKRLNLLITRCKKYAYPSHIDPHTPSVVYVSILPLYGEI